jgi:hypothetical protein
VGHGGKAVMGAAHAVTIDKSRYLFCHMQLPVGGTGIIKTNLGSQKRGLTFDLLNGKIVAFFCDSSSTPTKGLPASRCFAFAPRIHSLRAAVGSVDVRQRCGWVPPWTVGRPGSLPSL